MLAQCFYRIFKKKLRIGDEMNIQSLGLRLFSAFNYFQVTGVFWGII